jgi:hypothetical protein
MRKIGRGIEVRFDSEKNIVKQIDLEKLSKPFADFVRHLNFVFDGTAYGIGSAYEYTPKDIFQKVFDENGLVCAEVGLFKKSLLYHLKSGVWLSDLNDRFTKLISISSDGSNNKSLTIHFPECYDELRDFESMVRNYDLTEMDKTFFDRLKK